MLTTKILITVAVVCGTPELSELNRSMLLHELRAVVTRAESIYEYVGARSNQEIENAEVTEDSEHQLPAVELVETTDDQSVLSSAPILIPEEPVQNPEVVSDVVAEVAVESAAVSDVEISSIQESESQGPEQTESTPTAQDSSADLTAIVAMEDEVKVDFELAATVEKQAKVEADTETPEVVVEAHDIERFEHVENTDLAGIQEAWPTLDQQTRDAILLLVRADQLLHVHQQL